jgi:hypothetical protein
MKSVPFFLAALASAALANTAPTAVIQSAAMRPGTTLMDVVYRVNDPDDATVKTRALAFVDGVRSFAKVIKPVTFVEGTAAKLGDAIPSNTNHTLTWDVAADWNVDLGQVKFEVLAMDGRGLLPFDWITIPAAGGNPALTVSTNLPTNAEVFNALLWQYANGDTGLSLADGILKGNASTGFFNQMVLATESYLGEYSTPFIFKRMNLDPYDGLLATTARAYALGGWHAANRPYEGLTKVVGWGNNYTGQINISAVPSGVTAIAAGSYHSLYLAGNGKVGSWSWHDGYQVSPPSGLSEVTAIAANGGASLALKSDGTVVGWGAGAGAIVPAGLSGVTAIVAGPNYGLALKNDGTVVGWGTTVQAGLSGVNAITAGYALKSDGTVVSLGSGTIVLSGATSITAGHAPRAMERLSI